MSEHFSTIWPYDGKTSCVLQEKHMMEKSCHEQFLFVEQVQKA
jgi:hypothetical protein